jgi:hypothetical protein
LYSGVAGQGLRTWARGILNAMLGLYLLLVMNEFLIYGLVFSSRLQRLRFLLSENLLVAQLLRRRRACR